MGSKGSQTLLLLIPFNIYVYLLDKNFYCSLLNYKIEGSSDLELGFRR